MIRKAQFREIEGPNDSPRAAQYLSALSAACRRVGGELGWTFETTPHGSYLLLPPRDPGMADPVEFRLGYDPDCFDKRLPADDPRWEDCIVASQRVRLGLLGDVEAMMELRFASPLRDIARITPNDDIDAAMESAVREGIRQARGVEV